MIYVYGLTTLGGQEPTRPKESIRYPGTRDPRSPKLFCRCWSQNLGPSERAVSGLKS